MQRVKLDKIDRRILRDLQNDGRMTNVELSKRAGISAPPCLRRVRALEEAGFIRGYHADLEPRMRPSRMPCAPGLRCVNATCWRGKRISS